MQMPSWRGRRIKLQHTQKSEVVTALGLKANQATTYTITRVGSLQAPKATTTNADAQLALKATNTLHTLCLSLLHYYTPNKSNQAPPYTKSKVYNALAPKATTPYVDGQLALKANQADMTTAVGPKKGTIVKHLYKDGGR